jgi:hypothetical protein
MKRLIFDGEKRIDILLVYTKFMLVNGGDLSKENNTHIIHSLKRMWLVSMPKRRKVGSCAVVY